MRNQHKANVTDEGSSDGVAIRVTIILLCGHEITLISLSLSQRFDIHKHDRSSRSYIFTVWYVVVT